MFREMKRLIEDAVAKENTATGNRSMSLLRTTARLPTFRASISPRALSL